MKYTAYAIYEARSGAALHLPTQFFRNPRNKNRVGNTGWENSTKLQNLVFLLVKILGFAHPIFTRLHHPSRKLFYAVKWGNFANVV